MTTRFHALATWPQYERHIRAVWRHLPAENQGNWHLGREATARSIPASDVVLVAGYDDIDRTDAQRVVYVEHGAGQTYVGAKYATNYPGGSHPANVVGYICPSQRVADAWDRPSYVAGCPALDMISPLRWSAVITFHFDAYQVCPEARSARDHWEEWLPMMIQRLREDFADVLGTGHPKDPHPKVIWDYLGVNYTPDPDEALKQAGILIADNTSLMYEAAYLGIPVATLNAPWYRRDVEHGLRFWSHVPGYQFDGIDDFVACNWSSYRWGSLPGVKEMRERAAIHAYGPLGRRHQGSAAAEWLINTFA